MADHAKGSHCSYCGHGFPPDPNWPRTCASCGHTTYANPLPVAVALQPVRDSSGTGLVVVRRTIEPSRGTLALPGGFIETGETWQNAVVRELGEETRIPADAADVTLAGVLTDLDGHLLVFGLLPVRESSELLAPAPTDETDGWQLIHGPTELGFPLHTEAATGWFGGR